jgi:hydrogenase expression/formation protein HypC
MCLAIPGKIETIFEADGIKMARINFGGIKRSTCLAYTPDARAGDFVLVHVGFSLSIINEDEAERTYKMLEGNGEISEFETAAELADRQRD